MARIPYPDTADPTVAALVDQVRAARHGKLPMLFLMHMHTPALFEAWLSMGSALRYETMVDDRSRELAICAVAKMLRYDYQFHAHAVLAEEAGVARDALDRLPEWRDDERYTDRDRVVLAFTEAITLTDDVDDELFTRVREHFDDQKVMELTAIIAFYGCGANFLKTLRIHADDAAALT